MNYNDGHLIEGFDRVYIIRGMVEEHIIDHPAIVKAQLTDKAEKVSALLGEIYQGLCVLDEDK